MNKREVLLSHNGVSLERTCNAYYVAYEVCSIDTVAPILWTTSKKEAQLCYKRMCIIAANKARVAA